VPLGTYWFMLDYYWTKYPTSRFRNYFNITLEEQIFDSNNTPPKFVPLYGCATQPTPFGVESIFRG